MKRVEILLGVSLVLFGCDLRGRQWPDKITEETSQLSRVSADVLDEIEDYDGTLIVPIHENQPFFTEEDFKLQEFQYYSDLDHLQRAGFAFANVSVTTMPTQERGSIGMIKPSGWHTVRYDDLIVDHYLYNRCHLIGFQLTGQNANEKNLITGTRYFNVEGMLQIENQVAEYVRRTNHHVLYRVTPKYIDDDLVARGVLMEAQSIEDDRISICQFVYNIQPGITIDYTTGDSFRQNTEYTIRYILNRHTRKFHHPDCPSVADIKLKNKIDTSLSREEILQQGYAPCGRCHP